MQSKDFEWYVKNLKMLYEKYGNQYIAIKNQTVLGSYATYAECVRETAKTNELGSFIVQQCGQDERVYTNYISSLYI